MVEESNGDQSAWPSGLKRDSETGDSDSKSADQRLFWRKQPSNLVQKPNCKKALFFELAAPQGWQAVLGIVLKLRPC